MGIRDTRMVARALKNQWPVPVDKRPELMNVMVSIVLDPNKSARERTSAFDAILRANAQNLAAAKEGIELDSEGDQVDTQDTDTIDGTAHVISTSEPEGDRIAAARKRLGLREDFDDVQSGRADCDTGSAGRSHQAEGDSIDPGDG